MEHTEQEIMARCGGCPVMHICEGYRQWRDTRYWPEMRMFGTLETREVSAPACRYRRSRREYEA